jgi:hypothetical protein
MIEHELTDIPSNEVDQVIQDFESEGCTVNKIQQPDGKWTVIATCPS